MNTNPKGSAPARRPFTPTNSTIDLKKGQNPDPSPPPELTHTRIQTRDPRFQSSSKTLQFGVDAILNPCYETVSLSALSVPNMKSDHVGAEVHNRAPLWPPFEDLLSYIRLAAWVISV